MTSTFRRIAVVVCWLGFIPLASAQEFPYKLLTLLPDDFAVCVVMHDLRGQADHWQKSEWVQAFRQSPLGKTLLDAPELRQFENWQKDLKKHFALDWTELRDDVLGNTMLLSYSPGPTNTPEDERGLFLLQVHKKERLLFFVDKLNDLQKQSGELKSLTAIEHQGKTYFRRLAGGKTQYYWIDGTFAAVSSREELIRGVIEKRGHGMKSSPFEKRFQRAGADQAFVSMCINPRNLEPDFVKNKKADDGLPGYWRALEAIFVTFTMRDEAVVRIAIQADTDRLPPWTRPAFTKSSLPSDLWQRFPENSIVTLAAKTDIAATVNAFTLLLPDKDRKKLTADLQTGMGALIGLDIFKDVLPSIGPDWGVCVLPAADAAQLPQALVAVAVKPGAKNVPIDQALVKSLSLFAELALAAINKNNPDPILLKTTLQGKVEVRYLNNAKLFPPGLQPAYALKVGYLVFASTPTAIAAFRKNDTNLGSRPETPIFRLATPELSKLLRQREDTIVSSLKQRQGMSEREAKQNLNSMTSLMDLFEHWTLSQHAEGGQSSWTLRFTPARRIGSRK